MSTTTPKPDQKAKLFEIALSNLLRPSKLQSSLHVLTLVDLIVDHGPNIVDLAKRLEILETVQEHASSTFLAAWSTSAGAARLMNVWLEGAFSATSTGFHAMQGVMLHFLEALPPSSQLSSDIKLLETLEQAAAKDIPNVSRVASRLLVEWRHNSAARSVVEATRKPVLVPAPTTKRKQPAEDNTEHPPRKRRQQTKPPAKSPQPPLSSNASLDFPPTSPTQDPQQILSLEEVCDNLQPHEIVEFVEAAVSVVRAEQFQWIDGNPHSGMFILLALILKIISSKPLYQHLLSLEGDEAQFMLNSMQLLLDFPSSIIPSDRRSILKALLRLSNKSQLYPECLSLPSRVERSSQALAEGSYGEVYRGRFEEQNVALKVFKVRERSDISKILKAVWKEAILWSQLTHANLLPFYGIYHLGADAHSRVCLVSPWMENGNVVDYLKRHPDAERPLLLRDIAAGIAYLHEHEIIHGDLKGANILVSTTGQACLADFGLSKVADPALLRWTSINTATAPGGTLRWQAPELFTPEDLGDVVVTTKSDIYSFACVCYEIMTGQVPFHHISQAYTVLMKVMSGARPSKPLSDEPAFLEYGLTDPLWEMIEECWHQDPLDRPTAEEVLTHPAVASLIDRRQEQHWEGFSASQFRRAMTMLSNNVR